MSHSIDTQRSDEYRESLLVPSDAVKKAWETFEHLAGAEQESARVLSAEVVKVVHDFGKDLVPSTYEAAHLAVMYDELTELDSVNGQAAFRALEQYPLKDPQSREYVRTLAADLYKVNDFLNHQWDNSVEVVSEQPEDSEPIERQYKNPWERRYKTIPLKNVLELVADVPDNIIQNPEGVNIESILIGAALAYQTLRNAGTVSEDRLLRTMYDVDSFYRPLQEIIGYDAFVMALKRESTLIRMSRNGGEYDGVTEEKLLIAREMLRKLPPAKKLPGIIDDLVSKLTLRETESKPVLQDTSGHGIQLGTGRVSELAFEDIEDTAPPSVYDAIRYVWRVKTDTETAKKITEETKVDVETGREYVEIAPVSDLVGITIIVPSTDSLSYTFRLAAGISIDSLQLQPTPSRSRDTAFHAKGEDIIDAVKIDVGDIGAALDEKPSKNGHKVAKITLQFALKGYDPIPVEVQFQRAEDRKAARVGSAAHMNKQDGYIIDAQDLRAMKPLNDLHKRRIKTNEAGLTERSVARAREFFGRRRSRKTAKDLGAAVGRSTFVADDELPS